MNRMTFAATAAGVLAASSVSLAQHSDVLLEMQNGSLVTGRLEASLPVFPWAVFESELGEVVPNAALEPGFGAEPGALPPGAQIGLTVRRPLHEWDGAAFVPSTLQMRLTKGAAQAVTPAADPLNCQGPSLALGAATAGGGLHQDPAYELLAPASTGIYLLELEAWAGGPGMAASAPFFIVFNQNMDPEEFEAVVEWLELTRGMPCYANCDQSTASPVLNVADFSCFLQKFAAGECTANCDGSTSAPALNVADFSCFLQKFAAGCP